MRRCVLAILLFCPFALSAQTPEARAADLVSKMTLAEKVSQMQNAAPAIPRLQIPAYDWWNEALHGVARAGLATVFPQAIGLAATWDTGLAHRIADVISTEARAKYNEASAHDIRGRYHGLTFWSPNINIFRDPRWGRGQETYGEDPFLTAEMGIAFIKGMQGDDPGYFKTIATAKHFAVHSGPEKLRHGFDTDPSSRDLDDTYLYAFRRTVMEGPADSVMCAYNSVDKVPACANQMLLHQKLRTDWRFEGYVVSDCGAIDDIVAGHHFATSLAKASAEAVRAGTDLSCGTEFKTLSEAVEKHFITEKEIDESVRRLFAARFRLGLFDDAARVSFARIGLDQLASPPHHYVALEAAEKSIVLLKNTNRTLPLSHVPANIAVVGPAADDPDAMLGNYNGIPRHIVTPLEGIQSKFGGKAKVRFSLGSLYAPTSAAIVEQAGILAEYFDNDSLGGTPALSRTEGRIYFYRDMQDPAVMKALPTATFSVRWRGTIRVNESGNYQLGYMRQECDACRGFNSIEVLLDDKRLVSTNGKAANSNETKMAAARLEAGHSYKIRVQYVQHEGGSGVELVWTPPSDVLLKGAVDLVKRSDLAIVVVGLNSRLEGEEAKLEIPGFDHGDRTSLDLPASQESLLEAVLDTGKPTVVVLVNGSALGVKTAKQRASAILEAWYGGEEGGTAIANTLGGDNNPAGRLPVTFYESTDQLPAFTDYAIKGHTYRYFTGEPLFRFGFGLSYSQFNYSEATKGSKPSVRVTNTSQRGGDEVVQLYVKHAAAPNPELRGFERIHLRGGESRQVSFTLKPEDLHRTVFIGGGQPETRR